MYQQEGRAHMLVYHELFWTDYTLIHIGCRLCIYLHLGFKEGFLYPLGGIKGSFHVHESKIPLGNGGHRAIGLRLEMK